MGYDTVHLDDVEPSGPGGAVRFVRREIGCEAFGFNHFTLPPHGAGREHDERESGQEEVSFESTRRPVAGPNGLTFLSIGAPRGAYTPRGPF